ncbi:Rec8 like protein-domain-containing protein [Cantharellus anzutake]|uniref:Rec8 like protein-domain-containing protein n=1 Tax=Cantharellus anzutake TaxID=1750568 RepID=UPI0019047A7A|nr:Rec8 like protein-domain-containing protein [Cantharellus anzutake]KAF8311037.1 Rec8 like protein-domain-containing protein [Cantharellus anzutake]
MFFSNELLSQRDSGFGLLWLAATLGSRSTFKKLPRRSILNADISSLCSLIEEPDEPLALRLSSNLMVGVTRVYVAKCEIFAADVSQVHANLKKAVFEMKSHEIGWKDLVMTTSSVRPGLVTLSANDSMSGEFDLQFDLFEPFWGDITTSDLSFGSSITLASPRSDLTLIEPASSSQGNPLTLPEPQTPDMIRRGETPASAQYHHFSSQQQRNRDDHILNEDHLLVYNPTSDVSFGGFAEMGVDDGFQFGGGDNMVGLDFGGLDFGLGPEAFGEGESAVGAFGVEPMGAAGDPFENFEMDLGDIGFGMQNPQDGGPQASTAAQVAASTGGSPARKRMREELAEPGSPKLDADATTKKLRKTKPLTSKPIVDGRIELTDAELKASRDHYDQEQERIAREIEWKKRDKREYLFATQAIWEAPNIFCAPELVELWEKIYRNQVIAHKHSEAVFRSPEPPGKRRRGDGDAVKKGFNVREEQLGNDVFGDEGVFDPIAIGDIDMGDAAAGGRQTGVFDDMTFNPGSQVHSRQVSLDTPEIGRRALSRSHSALGLASQRSSFLPWEQGGFQSSDFDAGFPALSGAGGSMQDLAFGGTPDMLRIDGRGRGSQDLGREGSLGAPPSRYASDSPAFKFGVSGGEDIVNVSPNLGIGRYHHASSPVVLQTHGMVIPRDSQLIDSQQESQQSHLSDASRLVALERNALNFFEYTKQLLASKQSSSIRLQDIAPVETSTPRVAAAAFYHCLGLATKSLIRLKQETPYADVFIFPA